MDEYEEPGEIVGTISLEDTLNELTDYAAEHGILENNSVVYRDLFDTRLMNCLMPRPSEVVKSSTVNMKSPRRMRPVISIN